MMQDFSPAILRLFSERRKPLLMAHRGNRILFPENTLASFKQAFNDGADILETDLHLCADDKFICIHDSSVDRTTNGSGNVKDLSLNKLKTLRIIDTQSQPTEYQIPILEESLEMLPDSMALALELKTDRFLEPVICRRLASLLREKKTIDRTFVLSFSLQRLIAVRTELPEIPIGWISMTHLLPDKPVDLIGSFWPIFYLNPWYVTSAHRKNMFVCPLDPTPDTRLNFYLNKKVDAILSDNPGKTRNLLDHLIPNI